MPQRAIIGSQRFEASIKASADNLDDIALAFDEALGKTLKELVGWTLLTGQASNASTAKR